MVSNPVPFKLCVGKSDVDTRYPCFPISICTIHAHLFLKVMRIYAAKTKTEIKFLGTQIWIETLLMET